VTATTLLGVGFIVILAVEWRYRFKIVRVAAAVLAVLVWLFTQPNLTNARRRAMVMPPAERITQFRGGTLLSEYQSGVMTMDRAVIDQVDMAWYPSLMAVGVLAWLACSPAFRRERPLPVAESSGHELTDKTQ
jgi:hypothetical protein